MAAWKHFRREEFRCRGGDCCGGSNLVADDFVDMLDRLREACGFPFPITSGYRCSTHNQRVSSSGPNGPHTSGRAADIAVSHERAFRVVQLALQMGFTGVGVQQKGGGRFIHLDTLENGPGRPRPTIWSY